MTFTARTAKITQNSLGRFVLAERSGKIIPLNTNGYATGAALLKSAALHYDMTHTAAGVELSGLRPTACRLIPAHEAAVTRQVENAQAAALAAAAREEAAALAAAETEAAAAAAPFHVTVKHGRHPAVKHPFADRAAALDFARSQVGEDTLGYGARQEQDRAGRFSTSRTDGFGYHHEAVVTANAEYVEPKTVAALPSPDAKAEAIISIERPAGAGSFTLTLWQQGEVFLQTSSLSPHPRTVTREEAADLAALWLDGVREGRDKLISRRDALFPSR